jgi:hypothetical protein
MKYSGVFLDTEYNYLEAYKTELLRKKVEARAYLINLA